jgi:hypothetical protein
LQFSSQSQAILPMKKKKKKLQYTGWVFFELLRFFSI